MMLHDSRDSVDLLLSYSSREHGALLDVDDPFWNNMSLRQLKVLLTRKNGFYAFGRSLHVFGYGQVKGFRSLIEWNSDSLWKSSYPKDLSRVLCFAEDVFGNQFTLINEVVFLFDTETASLTEFSPDIFAWAARLLQSPDELLGYSYSRRWEQLHGRIPDDYRLTPVYPPLFVLGASFELESVSAMDVADILNLRGYIASQIQELPDGTKIEFDIS